MFVIFGRSLLICLLTIVFGWCGLRYASTPRPAYGEVFRALSPLLLPHMDDQGSIPSWRLTFLNTVRISYRVDTVDGTVSDTLDAVEQSLLAYAHEPLPSILSPDTFAAAAKETTAPLVLPLMRKEWDGSGITVLLILPPFGQAERSAASLLPVSYIPPAAYRSSERGLLAVMAFSASTPQRTTALAFWIDDESDLHALMPKKDEDAPGKDLIEAPRYPSLRRRYTVEENGPQANSTVVVYSGVGNVKTVVGFYREEMIRRGWDAHDLSPHAVESVLPEGALLFLRQGQQCLITVTHGSAPGEVQTVVAIREA